eukprot:gene4065-14154_t
MRDGSGGIHDAAREERNGSHQQSCMCISNDPDPWRVLDGRTNSRYLGADFQTTEEKKKRMRKEKKMRKRKEKQRSTAAAASAGPYSREVVTCLRQAKEIAAKYCTMFAAPDHLFLGLLSTPCAVSTLLNDKSITLSAASDLMASKSITATALTASCPQEKLTTPLTNPLPSPQGLLSTPCAGLLSTPCAVSTLLNDKSITLSAATELMASQSITAMDADSLTLADVDLAPASRRVLRDAQEQAGPSTSASTAHVMMSLLNASELCALMMSQLDLKVEPVMKELELLAEENEEDAAQTPSVQEQGIASEMAKLKEHYEQMAVFPK